MVSRRLWGHINTCYYWNENWSEKWRQLDGVWVFCVRKFRIIVNVLEDWPFDMMSLRTFLFRKFSMIVNDHEDRCHRHNNATQERQQSPKNWTHGYMYVCMYIETIICKILRQYKNYCCNIAIMRCIYCICKTSVLQRQFPSKKFLVIANEHEHQRIKTISTELRTYTEKKPRAWFNTCRFRKSNSCHCTFR